jgi:hypothetical protein
MRRAAHCPTNVDLNGADDASTGDDGAGTHNGIDGVISKQAADLRDLSLPCRLGP